jgi:hypothetical protein
MNAIIGESDLFNFFFLMYFAGLAAGGGKGGGEGKVKVRW